MLRRHGRARVKIMRRLHLQVAQEAAGSHGGQHYIETVWGAATCCAIRPTSTWRLSRASAAATWPDGRFSSGLFADD